MTCQPAKTKLVHSAPDELCRVSHRDPSRTPRPCAAQNPSSLRAGGRSKDFCYTQSRPRKALGSGVCRCWRESPGLCCCHRAFRASSFAVCVFVFLVVIHFIMCAHTRANDQRTLFLGEHTHTNTPYLCCSWYFSSRRIFWGNGAVRVFVEACSSTNMHEPCAAATRDK